MIFFNLIFQFTFSGDIINGYWMKLKAIKATKDLKEHLFRQKSKK